LAFTNRIREQEIREIFLYWLERRPPDGVPDRGSIDPNSIPYKHLPNLFLYELEQEGRFLCKLIGTEIARVMGKDETGRYLDEILEPVVAREKSKLFTHAVTSGRPIYYRHRALTARGECRLFSRILLPVSSGHGRIDQIFGMVQYGPIEYRSGQLKIPAVENGLSEVVTATADDLPR
jgi:hypothetical protein